jgi:AraC family transcriptional regulator
MDQLTDAFGWDDPNVLREWFRRNGATDPLRTCIGPLPATGAIIVRWTADGPDEAVRTIVPHPGSYRVAIQLEPHESEIWDDNAPVWSGVIGANRFRVCMPGARGRWHRLSGCDIVNLFIPSATVRGMAAACGQDLSTLSSNWVAPDRVVMDLTSKLLEAETLAGTWAPQFSDHITSALLAYLLQQHAQLPAASATSSLAGSRLQRILAYMAERMSEEIPVVELAHACAMSESHFSREFHKSVGMPPHQYLMKLRIERARDLLLGSDARVIDVALDLGFTNSSHFARAFARRYGMAPAAFRQLAREAASEMCIAAA